MRSNYCLPFTLKFPLLFVLAVCSNLSAFSQFSVSGQIIDEEGLGVPFSNVAILNPLDSSIVKGSASDFDGNFSLIVPAGSYMLRLSYIGYRTQFLDKVEVSSDLDFGQVKLETDVQKMDEVVIESTKYDVEVRPGVKAYNVGDSPAAEASSALDMLSNIPSASVGFDDEVSFRGRKVAIFIDGVESDVANILEQIPATEIESIEVISTPSAKWDIKNGESIINVVLKKNNRSGVTGNTALTVGNDDHQKINTGVKYTRPKYVVAGGASVVRNTSLDEGESLRTSFSNDTTYRNQIYAGETNDQKFNYRGKVRYNFSDKGFLEVKGSGGFKSSDIGKDYQTDWFSTEALTSVTDRRQRGDRVNDWFSGKVLFKQRFREDKSELRVRAQYTDSHQDNQFIYVDSVFYADGSFNHLGRNDQIIGNKRQRYSIDYEHGFDNSFKIELGGVLWNRQRELMILIPMKRE